MQQQPSPALSSPSTGFFGARASPLFSSTLEQSLPDPLPLHPASHLPRLSQSSGVVSRDDDDQQEQAPPKQLASALDGLGRAIHIIADVRSAADLLLEVLGRSLASHGESSGRKLKREAISAAVDSVRESLDNFQSTVRELEGSGILTGVQQKYEENQAWGLQLPLVCPDGAIVAYAWKRQIAGQAAAAAIERTRLALKSFSGQKRQYFPHLVDHTYERGDQELKIHSKVSQHDLEIRPPKMEFGNDNENSEHVLFSAFLRRVESDFPGMTVVPFSRLEWEKTKFLRSFTDSSQSSRYACSASAGAHPFKSEPGSGHPQNTPQMPELSKCMASSSEHVSILEVTLAGVMKAIISLFPTGSMLPDAISVFSPDEVGKQVHAWGVSIHRVHQQISDHAVNALHYFCRYHHFSALDLLLQYIFAYRSLFSKSCRECERILALDRPTDLLLPPIVRSFDHLLPSSARSAKLKTTEADVFAAYHGGCFESGKLKST